MKEWNRESILFCLEKKQKYEIKTVVVVHSLAIRVSFYHVMGLEK